MSYFIPERRKRKSILPLIFLGSLCVFALYYAFTANQKTVPVLPENAVRPHLVNWLENNPDAWPAQDPIFNPIAVRRIYRRTDYRLLWFDNYSLSDTANDLLKQLTASSSGNPSSMVDYRYHLGYFDRTLRDTPQRLQMAAVLDVLLTDAFISYAQDTQLDKLRPKAPKHHPRLRMRDKHITPVNATEGGFQMVSQRSDTEALLDGLQLANNSYGNHSGREYFRGYNRGSKTVNRSRYYTQRSSQGRQVYSSSSRYGTSHSARYSTRSYPRPYSANRSYPRVMPRFRSLADEGSGLTPSHGEGLYVEENTPFGNDAQALREQLARYRNMAASGRWRPLPAGPAMTLGAKHANVIHLRNMLTVYGDYYGFGDDINSKKFDQRLHNAVVRFQVRHGLKPDGIVGKQTRQRMNISPSARARIIETNIRRREKLPANLGNRFIQVNIPGYRLNYVEQDRVKLSMNVVVGKKVHQTPEINTRVARVVFNPTWTVPRSILVSEILPKARANPHGMENLGYRVVNGSGEYLPLNSQNLKRAAAGGFLMRQKGGEQNILGRIKFEIPNSDDIYLHDTRAKSLFSLTDRDYSHGCVRLEKPRQLAEVLLQEEPGDWSRYRIEQLTTGDDTTEVRMSKNVKVYLTYWTAWVDGQGRMHFRPDIYGKDGLTANQF
ncbi:L,D-transpeptidase family protein [Microbulbifer agarilyticus]|uniref:L,D-transpeptidase family protein n=1 Tax=Microbulbifer agarilyticus TaxID=260552 RepID=UPI001CD461F1|nr:L,D-transpeptidase family protein [Microbulbifer agarilyticus]MCA0892659.1 L,D-transpeptidase family protein [Microbulbifer agarilyticus]